jgi:transposase InsO family protein
MCICDRPIAPRSPWQNGHVERLIGSIRCECLDHIVVRGETHPRRVWNEYAGYYDTARTHIALAGDTPLGRPVMTSGPARAVPILGGLHHHYVRME